MLRLVLQVITGFAVNRKSGRSADNGRLLAMKAYEGVLESIRSEVSFGYETIRVYKAPKLESVQVGYAVKPTGEPLSS